MNDPRALQRLFAMLSPAFPTGAFAWSGGLESAVAEGAVRDSAATQNWICGQLRHGGLKTDALVAAASLRAAYDASSLGDIAELLLALTPAAERRAETLATGAAFLRAAVAWPSDVFERLPTDCPYPVAVGAVASGLGISVEPMLLALLTSQVASQVSVAVRLVPIGQVDGVAIQAALEPDVEQLSQLAATAGLDAIGGIGYAADIAQMRHETLQPRIFRS